MRDFIVRPAAHEAGLAETIRADEIAKPGQITHQVIEHVLNAKAAVVDLTGANPNVYYEMAIRHTARLPTVLIADESERGELPFDLQGMRTIFFSDKSLKSADACRRELVRQLSAALSGAVDSPVVASINLENLESGDAQGQILASLVNAVDALAREIRATANRAPTFSSPVTPAPVGSEGPLLLLVEAWLLDEGFADVLTQVRTPTASYDLIAENEEVVLLAELRLDRSRVREITVAQLASLPVPLELRERTLRRTILVASDTQLTKAALNRARDEGVEIHAIDRDGTVTRLA